MPLEYLPFVFFFIALFYSSVGFGGGSSYLAILSLVLTDFYEIRSTALILNIFVVTIGTLVFIKNSVLKLKLIWPFFVLSIPLAYLGAVIKLSQTTFFLILGGALVMAGFFMILKFLQNKIQTQEFSNPKKIILGGSIGLLSGISGIGGGIFLSPVLNLLNWANPRIIASVASVFILVNSLAGLIGLNMAGTFQVNYSLIFKLIIAVILGGSLGSYLSNKRFNLKFLGIFTAFLVIYVGLRLVLFHGFAIKI
ncbi:sulfite exporter TauE/SafE family protein [Salegentibacter sediminis]|uniref:sulfite exporter TauE/SafE family protein n=1 Tax=Salegentibacter sediminis TaxID=1930251 RepID=UPI0009C18221|nr:sulfite exporter TauE/SafE family protein [Salegentibacter sediminis]